MKIALLGNEPASQGLAPWGDPSWEIWSVSPGSSQYRHAATHWLEVHSLEYLQYIGTRGDYVKDLISGVKPTMALRSDERLPHLQIINAQLLLEEFGEWAFPSSVSWALAEAIIQRPEEIRLFGIDMSSAVEYARQRPACQYLIREAKKSGIRVSAPVQSDILAKPPIYGLETFDPMWMKMLARRDILTRDKKALQQKNAEGLDDLASVSSALDEIDYVMRTFRGEV